MKITNMEDMKPDNAIIRLYHDGKDFITIRWNEAKVAAWRDGKKVGSVKNPKWSRGQGSYNLYTEDGDKGFLFGIKRTLYSLSNFMRDDRPTDFPCYFVGETRLIPTKLPYSEDDLNYLERVRINPRTERRREYFRFDESYCKVGQMVVAVSAYFAGFNDERFEDCFGFELKPNQLIFLKNGNASTFTIDGVDSLICPCASKDHLTLAVIGVFGKQMKLINIDLG